MKSMDWICYFPVCFGVGVVEGSVGIAGLRIPVADVAERTVTRLSKESVQAENEARFGEHVTAKLLSFALFTFSSYLLDFYFSPCSFVYMCCRSAKFELTYGKLNAYVSRPMQGRPSIDNRSSAQPCIS